MAVVGDIYQIKDFQLLNDNTSNPFLNVYYYRVSTADVGITAAAVASKFSTTLLPKLLLIQSSALQHINLEVTNLMSLVDFTSMGFSPGSADGARSADFAPASVAWSFIYRRASLSSRNGWKRIGGVAVADISNGEAISGILTALDTAGDFMDDGMVIGSGQLDPVITRKTIIEGHTVTYQAFPVNECSYLKIGTQNTRKR